MKKILFLFLVLFPIIALAQPPPIQTLPISVDPLTQILYPTDATDGIISDATSALGAVMHHVRLVSTANITTLSGAAQTIDGFTADGNTTALLVAQTATSENGPWQVNSGAWTRPDWYKNGSTTQAKPLMTIYVRSGNTLNGSVWQLNQAGAITVGTTGTAWLVRPINAGTLNGTLAATAFPALTGDVTNSVGSLATTISNAVVGYAKIQNIAGLSVMGRSANSSGVGADIPGTDGQALRVSGTTLGFGTIVAAGIASNAITTAKILDANVTLAKLADVATGTVFYRKTAGTGVPEVQALATLKTDLGLTGTNSGDQTITLTGDVTGSGTASFAATIGSAAVTYAKIQNVAGLSVFGRSANSSGVGADITGTDGQVLRVSGTTLGFGSLALAAFPSAGAHTVLGNFTGSSAAPTYNTLGTGVDTFLVTPSAANLRATIASSAVTGTAGNLVFSGGPTFTSLTNFNGSIQIGTGTTSPQPLMAILGSPISFTAKIGADNSYAQFAFKNASDAQRGFIGYIGPTFSNALRQNNFEFGTASGTSIAFRPGDSDGVQMLIDTNGNFAFKNATPGAGAQGVLVFANSGVPTTSPTNTGQLYQDPATGSLTFRGRSGTVTAIALP